MVVRVRTAVMQRAQHSHHSPSQTTIPYIHCTTFEFNIASDLLYEFQPQELHTAASRRSALKSGDLTGLRWASNLNSLCFTSVSSKL